MATFKKGILGGFSGQVGPVVGTTWRGKDVMRSRPKVKHRHATEKQARQRRAFTITAQFLRPVNSILREHFGHEVEGKTRQNQAMSYHIEEAVTGTMPNLLIDYSKVEFTQGPRLPLQLPTAEKVQGIALKIAWSDNSLQVQSSLLDFVTVIAYNPSKKAYNVQYPATTRGALSYLLQLEQDWAGDTVHLWTFVTTTDGKVCSSSVYLGGIALE